MLSVFAYMYISYSKYQIILYGTRHSSPVFNGPISVISKVLTMFIETEIPRFNPCYYSTVYGVSPRSFPLEVSAEILWTPQGNLQELTLGEFVMRYEAVEEKGRCFMKRVLYRVGVNNGFLSYSVAYKLQVFPRYHYLP